mgnify:CR=1 FL=1
MKVEKIVESSVKFMENVEGKIAIVHDDDADGICSASLIGRLLEKRKVKFKMFSAEWNKSLSLKVVREVKKYRADFVIILDIPDIDENLLRKLENFSRIMIIDHHMPRKYNVLYVNPRVYDLSLYIPTSYLCFKILEHFYEDKDSLWICAAGCLVDYSIRACKDVMKRIKKEFKELVDCRMKEDELMEKSRLGLIVKIVSSSSVLKGRKGAEYMSSFLVKADLREFWENKKILKWFEEVEKEKERIIRRFERSAKEFKNFMYFGFKSRLRLKSIIASILSRKFKNKIIIVGQENKKIKLSIRLSLIHI